MANVNISQLPNLGSLVSTSVLPVDSGATTYHVTASNLAAYVNTNAGNVTPLTDNTYFLGNATHRWANLWLGPGTIYITDSANTANTAQLTVSNGILQINGATGLQANLIAGNTTLTLANDGNINMGVGGVANVLVLSNTGSYFNGNVTIGDGGDFTNQLVVDGNIHAVFDNLYETGGNITADAVVNAGRLVMSNQPGDPNIPGITTSDTTLDFSLGLLNDDGNVILNRRLVRTGGDTIIDIIPGNGQGGINPNDTTSIYYATDGSCIATDVTVVIQYGSVGDTDTEITKLLVTKTGNTSVAPNIAIVGQSITTTAFPPATYTAQIYQGGRIEVQATTDVNSSSGFYTVKAIEFGGYYGA
jgi:hypothetical protein